MSDRNERWATYLKGAAGFGVLGLVAGKFGLGVLGVEAGTIGGMVCAGAGALLGFALARQACRAGGLDDAD